MTSTAPRSTPLPRLLGAMTLLVVALAAMFAGLRMYQLTERGYEKLPVRFLGEGDLIGSLQIEDPILVHGVDVGKVESIVGVPGGALVQLRFWHRQPIFQDARIANLSYSLMGQRVLVLDPGQDSTRPLPEGIELEGRFEPGIAEVMTRIHEVLDQVVAMRRWSETEAVGTDSTAPLHETILGLVASAEGMLSGLDRAGQRLSGLPGALDQASSTTRSATATAGDVQREVARSLSMADSALGLLETQLSILDSLQDQVSGTVAQASSPQGPFAVLLRDDSLNLELLRQVDLAERMLDQVESFLKGETRVRTNLHLLGSNPSKRGE